MGRRVTNEQIIVRARLAFERKFDTQRALAAAMGIEEPDVSKLLSGDLYFTPIYLVPWATACETTCDFLLGLTDDPRPMLRVGAVPEERRRPTQFWCPRCGVDLVITVAQGRRERSSAGFRVPLIGADV